MVKIRYSLLTLVIACAAITAGIGVALSNSPWQYLGVFSRSDIGKFPHDNLRENAERSPDGSRKLSGYTEGYHQYMTIVDKNGTVLFEFPEDFTLNGFGDDNTLMCFAGDWPDDRIEPTDQFGVWHRCFPEWWWGHFYRPEVWLLIIFGSLWVWQIIRWFRGRRLSSPSPPTPKG